MTKRFVVWSSHVQTCMAWESRARAERFAEFWRDTALLGCRDWRVGALTDEPAGARPDARMLVGTHRPPSTRADAANDAPVAAQDELLELLARRDALIEELQRKLNDSRLAMARDAAAQGRRIAELEKRIATLGRGKAKAR